MSPPTCATIRPTNTIAPSDDGVYSVDFDEAGCSAISVAWSTPDGPSPVENVAAIVPVDGSTFATLSMSNSPAQM